METVGNLVKHVSGQLSDQGKSREYARWSRATLVEYLREAIKEVYAYRREAFAQDMDIDLVPGVTQRLPDGVMLVSATNADGSPIGHADPQLIKVFSAYVRCTGGARNDYSVKSMAIDPEDDSTFYVSPAVPKGIPAKMKARVNGAAPEYTLKDWDSTIAITDEYYNRLIDYMMARAYQRDTESAISAQQSQRLFSLFYQAMGVQYRMDSARGSGYYKGEIGDGDPRARA